MPKISINQGGGLYNLITIHNVYFTPNYAMAIIIATPYLGNPPKFFFLCLDKTCSFNPLNNNYESKLKFKPKIGWRSIGLKPS